jgi:hypothetical protein
MHDGMNNETPFFSSTLGLERKKITTQVASKWYYVFFFG